MTSHKSVNNAVYAARFVNFPPSNKPFGSTRDVPERKSVLDFQVTRVPASMFGTKAKLS